jgi:hypothetical protein
MVAAPRSSDGKRVEARSIADSLTPFSDGRRVGELGARHAGDLQFCRYRYLQGYLNLVIVVFRDLAFR